MTVETGSVKSRLEQVVRGAYPQICVFVISIATLACELAQNRIFSFQYWYHVVYFVITTALLGMAAGGSIYYYSRRLQRIPLNEICRTSLFLFSILIIISTLNVSQIQIRITEVTYGDIKSIMKVFLVYSIILMPYIFFGICLSAVFQKLREQSGKLYFFNLLGSAIGCVIFVSLVEVLGMKIFMVLLATFCALPTGFGAFGQSGSGARRALRRVLGPALFVGSAGAFVLLFAPQPDAAKQFNFWYPMQNRVVETTVWHPIARVDVLGHRGDPSKRAIVYDGDAQTTMRSVDLAKAPGDLDSVTLAPGEGPLRNAPYMLFPERPLRRVAVIGSGGGDDVSAAVRWGASFVDAVEINGATNRLVTGKYDGLLNGLFNRDDVDLITEDGRAFIVATENRYDRIVLFAIDSFAASASGAYIFSEAYLYTREAMRDFLRALDKDGVLAFSRWYYKAKDREAIRVFTTALETLADMGSDDPASHLLIVANRAKTAFATVFIAKNPLSRAEVERAALYAERNGLDLLFAKGEDGYLGTDEDYKELARAFAEDRQEAFYEGYPYLIEPVDDDSPFFFQYTKLSNWIKQDHQDDRYYEYIRSNPNALLFIIIIQTFVLVILIVFGPAFLLKIRSSLALRRRGPLMVYFMAIGLAFMFVEISLIQKMVLYLGTPVYAFAVVVPALLVFAATGSYWTGRFTDRPIAPFVIGTAIITSWILLWQLLDPVIGAGLLHSGQISRILFCILLLAPLGIGMGMPFPIGIRFLCDTEQAVPIMWAINSGCSVIASILVVPFAQWFGFRLVMLAAAGLYILASAIAFSALRREGHSGGAMAETEKTQ